MLLLLSLVAIAIVAGYVYRRRGDGVPDPNLHSIAGVDDSFGGRSQLREIINGIIPVTMSAHIEAKRPNYHSSATLAMIKEMSGEISDLDMTDSPFRISFTYPIKENNDQFITLLVDLWFEYEQPFFCFFQTALGQKRIIEPTMSWNDLAASEPCIAMFRSVEQDVVWIGKGDDIDFEW
jgi:hypothetical protein